MHEAIGCHPLIVATVGKQAARMTTWRTTGQPYYKLTEALFDSRDRTRLAKRLIRRLTDLGFHLQVTAPT